MGRRSRRRERSPDAPAALPDAPTADYSGAGEQVLTLRCVLTAKTRQQYASVLHGSALSQEDAWHRAVEFLFERLAVRWEISGVVTAGQKDLLLRLRAATVEERRFVRGALREHCADWFPDVEAP